MQRRRSYCRSLQIQKLEDRYCLAFTLTYAGGVLQFRGTAGVDTLTSIFIAKDSTLGIVDTVWFTTNTVVTDSGIFAAGLPRVGVSVEGFAGNDVVDFRFAAFTGFPAPFPLDFVQFWGGNDNDDFYPKPTGGMVPPPGPGTTFTDANIRFYGGPGIDTLFGSADPEYFQGHEGNDVATDTGGNDYFYGGPDDDNLSGGPGNDIINGEDGIDTLNGQDNNDTISGGIDGDTISGGDHGDSLYGDDGVDTIAGDDGDDIIDGGNHNDLIFGGLGNDTIDTGPSGAIAGGQPITPPGGGSYFEIVYGQDGVDWIEALLASGTTYLDGGNHNDVIGGSPYDDVIKGGSGNDTLEGMAGDDKILGEEDGDVIRGGIGNDELHGGAGWDILWSNYDSNDQDQPYDGLGPPTVDFTYNDMKGTGEADCDEEEGVLDNEGCHGAPEAVDDAYIEPVGTGAGGNVLENDSFWATTAILVTNVGAGNLNLASNGDFTWTPPDSEWTGTVTFTYKAADEWYESLNEATVTIDIYGYEPLVLDHPPRTPSQDTCGCGSHTSEEAATAPPLDAATLAAIGRAATERWREAGTDDATLQARLANLQFVIADLSGSGLGGHVGNGRIVIDVNAAGYGWFIDASALDDSEFASRTSRSQLGALADSPASGKADLLTVVMHEVGHALSLEHDPRDPTNVMNDTLSLGMRRLPTTYDAAIADYLFAQWSERRR